MRRDMQFRSHTSDAKIKEPNIEEAPQVLQEIACSKESPVMPIEKSFLDVLSEVKKGASQ